MAWQDEVLAFWFGLDPDQWWKVDPALDEEIRERFQELWEEQRDKVPEAFLGSARDALAAIILFDQLPRNMFRGHADQFSTDPLALALAKGAVERGYDRQVPPERRIFVYMPFEHSEGIEDQRQSLLLVTALGDENFIRYAKIHHDLIARFGRFPHRNQMLGRPSRPDEIAGATAPW
ncbi:MAG TPA: DUF924 family protein [Allosphingosinicella sp.]|nr:DUF924 family protein [Allosphingosinicella sp.]